MDLKPSSFFVSVVSFLGVIVPGAIVSYLATVGPARSYIPAFLISNPGSAQAWVTYAVASYTIGQALYAFGSWFLDPIYERTYLRYRQDLRGKGKPKELLAYATERLRQAPASAPFMWARAYVVTKNAGAASELEELEAESKFFRSLTLVFVVGPYLALEVPADPKILVVAFGGVALLVAGALANVVVEIRIHKLNRSYGDSQSELESNQAAGVMGLGLAVLVILAIGFVVFAHGVLAGVAFLSGFVVVFLRYSQQRWQTTVSTYQLAVAIDLNDTSSRGARVPASLPGTVGSRTRRP